MFTAAELAKARQISQTLSFMEKRAFGGPTPPPYFPNYDTPNIPMPSRGLPLPSFKGNPRMFNQAWDLYSPAPVSWMAPAPRMTLGSSMGLMGRGVGQQFGNYGQMLFTGHRGGSSILGNLVGDATQTLIGRPPSLHSLGESFSAPLRRAMPNLRESYRLTGQPGEWFGSQVVPSYQMLKNWITKPGPK